MRHWLIKSEPDCYSIDDLKRDKKTAWSGVRNYQARNFMKDMKVGDLAIFYHSNAKPPCAAGIASVVKGAYPDATALDKKDDHFDPRHTKDKPVWYMVDFAFKEKFKEPVNLPDIKIDPDLEGIMVAQRGSRLSVQPVSGEHFKVIKEMGSGS